MNKLLFKHFFLFFFCMCFSSFVLAQNAQCICKNNGSCVLGKASLVEDNNMFCQCKDNFIGGKCQFNAIQLKDEKQIPSSLNNQEYKYFYIGMEQQNIYAFFFHLCFDKSQITPQVQGLQTQAQNNSISFFFQIQEMNGHLDTNQNATHPATIQFQNSQTCKNIFIHYTPLAKTMLGKLQKLIFAVKYGKLIKSSEKSNNRLLSQDGYLSLKQTKLNIRVLQNQKQSNDLKIEIDYKGSNKEQVKSAENQQIQKINPEDIITISSKKQQTQTKAQEPIETIHKFKTQRTFTEQEQETNQNQKQIKNTLQQTITKNEKSQNSNIKKDANDQNIQKNQNKNSIQKLKIIESKEIIESKQIFVEKQISLEQKNIQKKIENNKLEQDQITITKITAQSLIQNNAKTQTKTQTVLPQKQLVQSKQSKLIQKPQVLEQNIETQQTQKKQQAQKLELSKIEKKKRIQKKVFITAMVYPFFDQDLIFNLLFSFTSIAGLLVLGAMGYIIRNRIIGIRHTMRIAAREKNNLDHFQEMIPPQRYQDFKQRQIAEQQCSICLTGLVDSDTIRYTPCQHVFHMNCLDSWCQQNLTCPMCRRSLRRPNPLLMLLSSSQIQMMNPTQENIMINH